MFERVQKMLSLILIIIAINPAIIFSKEHTKIQSNGFLVCLSNSGRCNIRNKPTMDSEVIDYIRTGVILEYKGIYGKWYKLANNGYIHRNIVSDLDDEAYSLIVCNSSTGGCNIREEPDINSNILDRVPTGTILKIIDIKGNWYELSGGGYIHKNIVIDQHFNSNKRKDENWYNTYNTKSELNDDNLDIFSSTLITSIIKVVLLILFTILIFLIALFVSKRVIKRDVISECARVTFPNNNIKVEILNDGIEYSDRLVKIIYLSFIFLSLCVIFYIHINSEHKGLESILFIFFSGIIFYVGLIKYGDILESNIRDLILEHIRKEIKKEEEYIENWTTFIIEVRNRINKVCEEKNFKIFPENGIVELFKEGKYSACYEIRQIMDNEVELLKYINVNLKEILQLSETCSSLMSSNTLEYYSPYNKLISIASVDEYIELLKNVINKLEKERVEKEMFKALSIGDIYKYLFFKLPVSTPIEEVKRFYWTLASIWHSDRYKDFNDKQKKIMDSICASINIAKDTIIAKECIIPPQETYYKNVKKEVTEWLKQFDQILINCNDKEIKAYKLLLSHPSAPKNNIKNLVDIWSKLWKRYPDNKFQINLDEINNALSIITGGKV